MVKTINTLDIRKNNRRNIILALHYYGPMSKQQMADTLGLSLQTVSIILKELREEGLVDFCGVIESTGGRRAKLVALVPDAKYACGIGITKKYIYVTVVNLRSQVTFSDKSPVDFANTEEYWAAAVRLRDEALQKSGVDKEKLLGTGISIPGIVDDEVGKVIFAPTLGEGSIDLSIMYKVFGEKIHVINDAKSAGFAYTWSKKRETKATYLLISRGIGGAIIARQTLATEARAGEFGHLTIEKDGKLCSCGQRGCFEAYCSSGVLTSSTGLNLEEFFKALKSGNSKCREIWDEYLDYLAVGINNIRVAFDTDVVIGGEMSRYIAQYEDKLKALLVQRNPFGDTSDYVKISDFGEYDSSIGCAHRIIDGYLS
mgnify:CR=1 FL=1